MTRLAISLAAALSLSAPALAADHEISFEVGNLHNSDLSWDLFSANNGMPSYGLRAGFAFHDRLAVVGGWHHLRRGRDLYFYDDATQGDAFVARTAFIGNEFTLGLKADIAPTTWLQPYATVQGMVLQASWKYDDDPSDKDSPGQMSDVDASLGLLALGGVELHIPQGEAPFTIATYFEAGWGAVGEMVVCPVGNMTPGGFTFRAGWGLRF